MNSGFKFRLEKVLTFQEDCEKAAHRKFVSAQNLLQASQEELAQLKYELTDVCNGQTTEDGATFDLNSRLLSSRYADYLTGCIIGAEKTVFEKETEVIKERFQLEAKMKERKILSSLKDKKSAAYNLECKLAEQKQNDEFATIGFCRR